MPLSQVGVSKAQTQLHLPCPVHRLGTACSPQIPGTASGGASVLPELFAGMVQGGRRLYPPQPGVATETGPVLAPSFKPPWVRRLLALGNDHGCGEGVATLMHLAHSNPSPDCCASTWPLSAFLSSLPHPASSSGRRPGRGWGAATVILPLSSGREAGIAPLLRQPGGLCSPLPNFSCRNTNLGPSAQAGS